MSYDESDAAYDQMIDDIHKSQSQEPAKRMLGTIGDAMEIRINNCLQLAEELLEKEFPGPSLVSTATAGELLIRFMILRPLIAGAFLSEDWEAILTEKIATGRSSEDRRILPDVLSQWGISIESIQTSSNVKVWEFLRSQLWKTRDEFVHKGETPSRDFVITSLECIKCFKETALNQIASKLGFTLAETGKWSVISMKDKLGIHAIPQTFNPWDPISGKELPVVLPRFCGQVGKERRTKLYSLRTSPCQKLIPYFH